LEDKPTEVIMKREEPEPPGYQGSPFNHSLLDFSRKVSEISFLLRAALA